MDALYAQLSLLVFPALLFLVIILKVTDSKQCPPGPPRLPIIGNLLQLGKLPHQSLWSFSKKYGPVMFLKLGRIPLVVVSSPESAKQVLKTHDLHSCSRPSLSGARKLSYNCSDIAFSPYGNLWREMRKICVLELLSTKMVQSYRFMREEEVFSLVDSISKSSQTQTPVDLSEKIYNFFASVIFRMSVGMTFQGSALDNERLSEVVQEVESVLGSFSGEECIPYVGWVMDKVTGHHKKIEKVFRKLDTLFEGIIDGHINFQGCKDEKEKDIVDVLLRLQKEQIKLENPWLTKNHIKAILFASSDLLTGFFPCCPITSGDQPMDIILAGTDTGAITVTWAMSELVRNPRLLKKAQNEVRNITGTKERLTEDDISQLEYLKLVIKETLRLHPPVPLLLPRETMSHFKINGFDIYPKTLVQINAWAIGRDPNYWNNPEEFFPERFANTSIDFKGKHFELLPFGAGRRVCPGIHLGTTTIELVLANLLYCFDWKFPDGMKEEDMNMEEGLGQRLDVHKEVPLELVPVSYIQ
ncbi:hypothetical protein ACFE04_024583 [Oxalis oulophora]